MVNEPKLFLARVMHHRLFPKKNSFGYGVYYMVLPLPATPIQGFLNRFDPKDIGPRNGDDPTQWMRGILEDNKINEFVTHIVLVTMPRVLGYVFNPISLYFCMDEINQLRAVLCEVHNTFGEQHCYLCMNKDNSTIKPDQWLQAEKCFHVSPFLERSGFYNFRFDFTEHKLGIWINYYDEHNNKKLATSLKGNLETLNTVSLGNAFWKHPFVGLKAIVLIHWQALKILTKGIRHRSKPKQIEPTVTRTNHHTPMHQMNHEITRG